MNRVLFKSERQNWKTPKRFYEELNREFAFDFDPCLTTRVDWETDGLNREWGKCNFVNPPYSDIKRWVAKSWLEFQKGKRVVLLIPSRTDTKWWHEYCMKATEIRFIEGRLRFDEHKNAAPFPSCLVIFDLPGPQ